MPSCMTSRHDRHEAAAEQVLQHRHLGHCFLRTSYVHAQLVANLALKAPKLRLAPAPLAHHSRRRSICGGEARDGRVGQQKNVRRGRVISLAHVGKLQQVRLTRGLLHDLLLAAPPPGDRRSRRRGSLSGTTLRSLQLHRRTGRLAA